jgi:hypothetical protein
VNDAFLSLPMPLVEVYNFDLKFRQLSAAVLRKQHACLILGRSFKLRPGKWIATPPTSARDDALGSFN